MRNLAIIPVRLGSKRLPRKNVLPFNGVPMFVHTYRAALQSKLFQTILVSTESEEVLDICDQYDIPVPFKRPEQLATDAAQLVSVIDYSLQELEGRKQTFDNFCLLWATAPLRTATHIVEAFEMLRQNPELDGVLGTTVFNKSVFSGLLVDQDGLLKPLFPEEIRKVRSEQPVVVVDNSSMVWNRVNSFINHKTWLPPRLASYQMPEYCSVDLDTEQDLALLLYLNNQHHLSQDKGN